MGARIKLDMSFEEAISIMGDGNLGAIAVMCELFKKKGLDAVGLLCHLDDMGIYGSDIWIAYKDVCKERLHKLIELIPQRDLMIASIAGAKRLVG